MHALRAVGIAHRTLGSVLWFLFLVWFASGIVMTFAGFPSITEKERLERAPVLHPDQVLLSPARAIPQHALDTTDVVSLGARAVYRTTSSGTLTATYADTGEAFSGISEAQGAALGAAWLRHPTRILERLDEVDQWTPQVGSRQALPLLHLAADDEDGTEVYVSLARAEVMQRTTRRTRVLAWMGAIPHWIYPVQLRRHASAWRATVIVLAGLGTLVAATGVVHGLRVVRLGRRSARGIRLSVIPFRERWLRWHHLSGLVFGVFAFTWVLSGLFSLVPFGSSSGSEPRSEDLRAFRGGDLVIARFDRELADAIQACVADARTTVKRLDFALVGGVPFYVCRFADGRASTLRAEATAPPDESLDRAWLTRSVHAVGAGAAVEAEQWLDEPDAYYYPSHFDPDLTLPVLRTRFANGVVIYAAPTTATVERRFSTAARAHRWLYHGLHSLDFPPLYRRELTWRAVILGLASGGGLLAATGTVLAFRRRRHVGDAGTVRAKSGAQVVEERRQVEAE